MKLTKVDRVRMAVSRYEEENGRSILYPVPNQSKVTVTNQKIKERVDNANRLYHVFFRNDIPKDLEGHFEEICKIASKSNKDSLIKNLMIYREYEEKGKNFKKQIRKFEYASSGKKDLKDVLQLHIRQRMKEEWQKEEYSKIIVAILKCICNGKKYKEEIKKLYGYKKQELFLFMNLCKKHGGRPYVESTSELENVFSLVIKAVAEQCDVDAYYRNDIDAIEKNLEKQITFLEKIVEQKPKNSKEKPKKIELDKFSYEYAQEERMNAILVRMRKSLKRDNQRQIAIKLLQAVARMENQSLSSVIKQIKEDEQQYLLLKKFLIAVNKDYHHINIVISIKNMDIKVQPNKMQLDLSSVKNEKKKVLNETLEQYASSEENSDEILLRLKTVLFDYFSIEDKGKKFLTKGKIWSFPMNDIQYFDSEFVPFCSEEEINNQPTLEDFWVEHQKTNRKKDRAIKKRINYVNYGKYLTLTVNETDEFRKYWCSFIKEYIEKEIVNKKEFLQETDCFNVAIMMKCWKHLIRFLCGKYIDIGKSVYHFVVPEDMTIKSGIQYDIIKPEYGDGISSFALEVIKAEETRQRVIAHATATAVSNFSRAIVNYDSEALKELKKRKNVEDIITITEIELKTILKEDSGKQLLRFYGGMSNFAEQNRFIQNQGTKEEVEQKEETQKLVIELWKHFKKLRNANFHYTEGKEIRIEGTYTELLMANNQRTYEQTVKKRYYSNNASLFYREQDICALVTRLYSHTEWKEAQIPAFSTVWKQKDMVEDLKEWKEITLFPEWQVDKNKTMQFTLTLYYLLKEIYYHEFINGTETKERFFKAVDNYVNKYESKKCYNKEYAKYAKAGINFQNYLRKLDRESSFGMICQSVMQEYNQQNAKAEDEEIYKHFKMLLPLCIKYAFQDYINEKKEYSFLRNPSCYERTGEPTYLEEVAISYHFSPKEQESKKLYEIIQTMLSKKS